MRTRWCSENIDDRSLEQRFQKCFCMLRNTSCTTTRLCRCRCLFFLFCYSPRWRRHCCCKRGILPAANRICSQGQKMHEEKYLSPRVAPEQTKNRVSQVSFRFPAPASNGEVLANAIFASSKVRFSRTDASAEQGSARQNRITYACLSAVFLFRPVNVRSEDTLKAPLCRAAKSPGLLFFPPRLQSEEAFVFFEMTHTHNGRWVMAWWERKRLER